MDDFYTNNKLNNLREKFPSLFKNIVFECGDGWYDILEDLAFNIKRIDVDCEVKQVKEKFGLLRVYVNSDFEEVYDLIHDAENKSKNICEKCGSDKDVILKAKPSNNYWLVNWCEKCRIKDKES